MSKAFKGSGDLFKEASVFVMEFEAELQRSKIPALTKQGERRPTINAVAGSSMSCLLDDSHHFWLYYVNEE